MELRWLGAEGELGELRLSERRIFARLARRQIGAVPIYDSVYEAELTPLAARQLGRELERSGVFDIPEAIEDASGHARSLRLELRHESRSIEVRSRAERTPELDRVVAAIDARCAVQVFASLPRPPAARSRPAWHANSRQAFELQRRLFEHEGGRSLALDLFVLARELGVDDAQAKWREAIREDVALRRIALELRAQHAAPLR